MSKNSNNTVGTTLAPVEPKPLNQTQLKNLQALVDGDFSDLRGSALNDLQQRVSRRKEEIIRKYEAVSQRQAALQAELEEMVNQAVVALDAKIRAKATKAGAEVKPGAVVNFGLSNNALAIPNDRDKELARVQEAYNRLAGQVQTMINREHRKISRTVLMQGITAISANEIIADLPIIADIYQLIGSETQLTNGDDIALLLGDAPQAELTA